MTPKQEMFALEYLKDLNATAAYKRAGYKGNGNVAESTAAKLLSNPKVAAHIQASMNRVLSKLGETYPSKVFLPKGTKGVGRRLRFYQRRNFGV